jgi:hypothetical protein
MWMSEAQPVHQGDGRAVGGRAIEVGEVDGVLVLELALRLLLDHGVSPDLDQAVEPGEVLGVEGLLGLLLRLRSGQPAHRDQGRLRPVVPLDGVPDHVLRGHHDLHRVAAGAAARVVDGEEVGGVAHGQGEARPLPGHRHDRVLPGEPGREPLEDRLLDGDGGQVDGREAVRPGQDGGDLGIGHHLQGDHGARERAPVLPGVLRGLVQLRRGQVPRVHEEGPELLRHPAHPLAPTGLPRDPAPRPSSGGVGTRGPARRASALLSRLPRGKGAAAGRFPPVSPETRRGRRL